MRAHFWNDNLPSSIKNFRACYPWPQLCPSLAALHNIIFSHKGPYNGGMSLQWQRRRCSVVRNLTPLLLGVGLSYTTATPRPDESFVPGRSLVAPVSWSYVASPNKSVFSLLQQLETRYLLLPPCCCGCGSKGGRACCRRAMQQPIDIGCPRGPQQQTRRTLLQRSIDRTETDGRTDRHTDGRTPYRYIGRMLCEQCQ